MLWYVRGWELDLFEWNEGSCFELLVRRWKDWEENAIESREGKREGRMRRVDPRHFPGDAWRTHSREVLSLHSRRPYYLSPESQPPSCRYPSLLHQGTTTAPPPGETGRGMTLIRPNWYSSPNKEITWFDTLLQFSARVIKNRYSISRSELNLYSTAVSFINVERDVGCYHYIKLGIITPKRRFYFWEINHLKPILLFF